MIKLAAQQIIGYEIITDYVILAEIVRISKSSIKVWFVW